MDADDRQLRRRRLLGWSLACGPIDRSVGRDPLGRDLALTGGDLAVVSDIDNLGQSLQLALTTRLGDDPFDAGFGFDGLSALVEESNPLIARERIRVAVIQVLRRDPRVRGIVDLQLDDETGDPVPPRTMHVRVVFETVAGDQASADLMGVISGG
jgi:phage baseplate assembly protein W